MVVGGPSKDPQSAHQFTVYIVRSQFQVQTSLVRVLDLNHSVINHNKTREIVFHLPRVRSLHLPPKDDSIERVSTDKLLGVMFQGNLKFDTHIQYVLTLCNR